MHDVCLRCYSSMSSVSWCHTRLPHRQCGRQCTVSRRVPERRGLSVIVLSCPLPHPRRGRPSPRPREVMTEGTRDKGHYSTRPFLGHLGHSWGPVTCVLALVCSGTVNWNQVPGDENERFLGFLTNVLVPVHTRVEFRRNERTKKTM